MGTRAQFFVGEHNDPASEFLGTVWGSGMPTGWPKDIARAASEAEFRRLVHELASSCPAFADPYNDDRGLICDWFYAWTSSGIRITDMAADSPVSQTTEHEVAAGEVRALFHAVPCADRFGAVKLEVWPEGLVLWVGGKIRWCSWRDPELWNVKNKSDA